VVSSEFKESFDSVQFKLRFLLAGNRIYIHYRSESWGQFFFFFLNKWPLLFSKDTLNWSKVTVKAFMMLQKVSVSNKCCYFTTLLFLLYFWSNKCSHGEQKILLIITFLKILQTPNIWTVVYQYKCISGYDICFYRLNQISVHWWCQNHQCFCFISRTGFQSV